MSNGMAPALRWADTYFHRRESLMTFLKKIFGRKEPVQRVQVCVECGMPVGEHRDWCSILRLRDEHEGPRSEQA